MPRMASPPHKAEPIVEESLNLDSVSELREQSPPRINIWPKSSRAAMLAA